MPSANHAISGANGNYCVRCSSSIGDAVKVQPFNVDGETYCPRCACWWRMHQPEEQGTHDQPRFNASQCCVAKCQFCEWIALSFGAQPGRQLRCGHCGKPGAIRMRIDQSAFTKIEQEAIRDAQERTMKELVAQSE